jgi:hypothetical protein
MTMPVTDADFAELSSRVARLERASVNNTETVGWLAGTLGGMKAVQDDHTQRLDRLETGQEEHTKRLVRLEIGQEDHTKRLERIETDLRGLIQNLPSIVSDAMREVMRKS